MLARTSAQIISALILACLSGQPVAAQTSFPEQFQDLLAAARIDAAEELARNRLAASPGDAAAQFALGTAQFLGAVEGLGLALYQHGLTPLFGANRFGIPGVTDLPFLRIPVAENPAPQPFSAAAFREMLTGFGAQLAEAEASLAAVPVGPVALPLDVGLIRLDMNGDGKAQDTESLLVIIGEISGVWSDNPSLAVRFDESDVPWLRGYSHLLGGVTDILLAHDWTETIEQTFQSAFPASPLAAQPLNAALPALLQALEQAQAAGDCDYPDWVLQPTPEQQAREDRFYACQSLAAPLEYGGIGDLVAFVHLFRWPVVEPARLSAARQHFLSMITLSRQSWALILAEIDDDKEWLSGPRQRGPFSNMRVTDETVAGWMGFLDQAEGVLEGRYLIPHWRFDNSQGINIRRMFEEPRTLDPILLITGSGAIPYIDTGPLAPGSTLDTGLSLLDGGMLAYFLWFN